MQAWRQFVEHIRWADIFDIAVCAIIAYTLLAWMRRRASYAVATACLLIGALYLAAHIFEMFLTLLLMQVGFTVMLLALVVVFQQDLRRGFEQFVAWRPWRRSAASRSPETIDSIVEALAGMAEDHIGALIVMCGREPIEPHTRGGIPLQGAISVPLLRSLFDPDTPGHDGAAVVRRDRVAAFAVHLPLSANLELVGPGGTRHAAGLGLAERCDALVVIVSEERGTISVAHENKMTIIGGAAELQRRLTAFQQEQTEPRRHGWFQRLTRNLGLKLTSLVLAGLLWFTLAYRVDTVQRIFENVPVEIRNLPEGWIAAEMRPSEVRLTVTGTDRAFDLLQTQRLRVTLDLSKPEAEGMRIVPVTETRLNLPPGLSLTESEPESVRLQLQRVAAVQLPVLVKTENQLPGGRVLQEFEANPATVTVLVPLNMQNTVKGIPTEPIDLSNIDVSQSPAQATISLLPPGVVRLAEGQPHSVQVTLTWERPADEK